MIFEGSPDILYPPTSPSTLGALSAATDDQIRTFMSALMNDPAINSTNRGPILLDAMRQYQVSFDDIVQATRGGFSFDQLYQIVSVADQTSNSKLSPTIALQLAYLSMVGSVNTSTFNEYGGYNVVMSTATAAGMTPTPQWIANFEVINGLPPSDYTRINTGTPAQVLVNAQAFAAEQTAREAADLAEVQAREVRMMESTRALEAQRARDRADEAARVAAAAAAAAQAALATAAEVERARTAAAAAAAAASAAKEAQDKANALLAAKKSTDAAAASAAAAAMAAASAAAAQEAKLKADKNSALTQAALDANTKAQADALAAKLLKVKADEAAGTAKVVNADASSAGMGLGTIALAVAAFYLFGG